MTPAEIMVDKSSVYIVREREKPRETIALESVILDERNIIMKGSLHE